MGSTRSGKRHPARARDSFVGTAPSLVTVRLEALAPARQHAGIMRSAWARVPFVHVVPGRPLELPPVPPSNGHAGMVLAQERPATQPTKKINYDKGL